MSRLGIGIIGLGPTVEPHARSLQELSDKAEVRLAATRTEARANAFAHRFDFPVTTDVQAVLEDEAIQAVLVLTASIRAPGWQMRWRASPIIPPRVWTSYCPGTGRGQVRILAWRHDRQRRAPEDQAR